MDSQQSNQSGMNNEFDGTLDQGIIESIIGDRAVRRSVTRESHVMFFSVYFAEYLTFPMAPFHWEMFRLIESDERMVVLMAFRGSGKSTIFTLSYPIWAILGKQQKKFIVILAQTQQQAKLYITNIKRELENNQLLRDDLGPFYEGEEEWSSGTLVFPEHNARITALSMEQSIRGLRHGSHRPDLIICDDLEDLSSVKTHENRSRAYSWLLGDVIPSGDKNTKVVVIGNMLHEESLLMRLKKEIEIKNREGVFRRFPFFREDGSVAWPGKFRTAQDVSELQRMIGDDTAWCREFLLQIVSTHEQVVHPDWIKTYSGEAPPGGTVGIGVDLAISDKETADYTAMVCVRVVNGIMYVLPNPINERLSFPETIERIRELHSSFGTRYSRNIYVENVGYQAAVTQQLAKEGIHAEGVNPQGQDKRARIALTTNHIKNGLILFPEHGAEELVRQLTGFGSENHDDLADAFTIVALKYSSHLHYPSKSKFVPRSRPRYDEYSEAWRRPYTANWMKMQF